MKSIPILTSYTLLLIHLLRRLFIEKSVPLCSYCQIFVSITTEDDLNRFDFSVYTNIVLDTRLCKQHHTTATP